jgi:hypothetical protein
MHQTHTLLYLIYEAGNVQPAIDLCAGLQRDHGVRCVLFSPYHLPQTAEYVERARSAGICYLYETTALGGLADLDLQLREARLDLDDAPPTSFPSGRRTPLSMRWIALIAPQLRAQGSHWVVHYENRLTVAHQLLARLRVTRLAMAEDNVERDSACWCEAALARGAQAFVISYASITPHEAAIAYRDHPDYQVRTRADRVLALLRPAWHLRFDGLRMLRLPAPRAWALECLGLAPYRPWVVNTGRGSSVLVESAFMRDLFVRHGVRGDRVHVTGTIPMDVLAQQVQTQAGSRIERLRQLGCEPTRPTLVCAIAPNQYPVRPAYGHASFDALIDAWLDAMQPARERFNILLSPHPSLQNADLRLLSSRGDVVCRGSVMDIMGLCDLYVACVSSTIKWALACKVPVVNFDCYRYRYDDYAEIAHVHTIEDAAALRDTLVRFCDPAYLREQAHAAAVAAPRYGVLDGHARERLVKAMFT